MGFGRGVNVALDYVLFSILRFIQLIFAVTVCGLYGVDLNNARIAGVAADGRWVYAEVIGGLSAFTCVLYFIPFIMGIPFMFVWDFLLCFMWIVLFAIFGKLFIHENPEGDAGIERMKNAVWIDLVNMLLWFISAILMLVFWIRSRRSSRGRFTGRAQV